VARSVHHQEGDEAAALIDHRQADLAAELVRLATPAASILSSPLGEAMAATKSGMVRICLSKSPTRARVLAQTAPRGHGLVMMPCVSACPMSASMTLRFGAMP